MKKVQLFPQHLITSELRLNYLFAIRHTPYSIPMVAGYSTNIVSITITSEGVRIGEWRRRWFYCLLLSLDSLSFQISFTLFFFLLLYTGHLPHPNCQLIVFSPNKNRIENGADEKQSLLSFYWSSSRVTVTAVTATVAPLSKRMNTQKKFKWWLWVMRYVYWQFFSSFFQFHSCSPIADDGRFEQLLKKRIQSNWVKLNRFFN